MTAISAETLERLKAVVGRQGWLEAPADVAPYCESWRDDWRGATPLVLRPASTAEVAALVAICAETRTPIVPQGGNTGLTGGGQPHQSGAEIVVSTGRMRRIREIDPANDAITVEAGATLAAVQWAAAEADRLFPLSLAAEGTCQIGGALATNAGGVQVLRYGNMRALTLGLQVVTADGAVWNGLRGLRKDNAGYDLKQLFIGSEGTLGIITAATLKLAPRPRDSATALAGVPDPDAAVALLAALKGELGETLSAFELMREECFAWAAETLGHDDPLPGAGWRVLIQADGPGPDGAMRARLETALAAALEAGGVSDAVIAASLDQATRLWRIREDQAEVQQRVGAGIRHDISVPVSHIPEFLSRADAALRAAYPGARRYVFGHLGDGNLHYNPVRPADWSDAGWKAETEKVNRLVHDLVAALGGSITAEHGVGRLRRAELARLRSPVEIAMMRRLKQALDPDDLFNPGKLPPPIDDAPPGGAVDLDSGG